MENAAKFSQLFCDPHADITFRSSDDVLLKIHSKYLEATSARLFTFAERKTSEFDDQAPLDETSEVLEILFQFVHPPGEGSNHQQPSIMDIKPEIFFAVAGASEKYVVFSAMSIFMLHMHQMKKKYPLEILNHCDAYDYIVLANDVALDTLSYSLQKVGSVLTHPGLLAKWLEYYRRWLEIPKFIDELIEPYSGCPKLVYWHFRFFQNFQKNPLHGLNSSVIENKFSCSSSKPCPCGHQLPFQEELTAKKNAFPCWSAITRSLDSTMVEYIDPHIEIGPDVSSLFGDASADLTFRSLDNILFKIHGKYLEATSEGLAPPPSTLMDRAHIALEEPSAVLEILFQFIHPPSGSKCYRQPDVRSFGPDIFFAVAEAAEKYIVFGAINLCMTRMHQLTQDYPVDILRHSCKHGYKDLADIIAPHTLSYQLGAVAPKLSTILYHWVRSISLGSIHESNIEVHRLSSQVVYYDQWQDICRDVDSHIWKSKSMECRRALMWQAKFNHQFAENPLFIFSPLSFSKLPSCKAPKPCPCGNLPELFSQLAAKGRSIPNFSSIAFPPSG